MPRWVARGLLGLAVELSFRLRWKTERERQRESGCRSRDSIRSRSLAYSDFKGNNEGKQKSRWSSEREKQLECMCVCLFLKEGHLVATSRNYRASDEIRSESNNDLAAGSDLLGNFRLGKENKLWCFLMFCLRKKGFEVFSHTSDSTELIDGGTWTRNCRFVVLLAHFAAR